MFRQSAQVVARIVTLRKARGMSVQKFTSAMAQAGYRFTVHTQVRYERGRVQTVAWDYVLTAARVLGIPAEYLLAPQTCGTCGGAPPPRFTCQDCGLEGAGSAEGTR